MEEIFSTLLYLIPLAFFIFLRVRRESRRQAEARKKPAPIAARGAAGGSPITRPKGRVVEVREVRQRSGIQSLFERLVQDRPVRRETGESGPVLASYAQKAPEPPREIPPVAAPAAAAPVQGLAAGKQAVPEAKGWSVPGRIAAMSPLRQAVVMSEILGKPKALQD